MPKYSLIYAKKSFLVNPDFRESIFSQKSTTTKKKGYLKFEILDTGKGMSAEELCKIFEMYS